MKSIYRWMDLSEQPQFSFIEKLFLSGKKHHKIAGHSLLLGKAFGAVLLFVLPFVILFGIICVVIKYRIISLEHFVSLLVILAICMLGGFPLVMYIRATINDNNTMMKQNIETKLNEKSK